MKNVADLYPLSPMQEMMLLHALSRPNNDVLFNQFCYEISGDLNVAALRGAWQRIVSRHTIFRTAFVWQGIKQPVQIIRQQVELPFEILDWRSKSAGAQDDALAELRVADRKRGFQFAQAPLTRITLVRLEENRSMMIWASHHLLIDRWCLSTLFGELRALYDAAASGREAGLAEAAPYRDYIGWIDAQDKDKARTFWRQALDGFDAPIQLTNPSSADAAKRLRHQTLRLSDETALALGGFARRNGVTLSTVIQGAWALLLNQLTHRQDVVYGVVASGRPPGLTHVESIVGSFVNNLPVRIQMPRGFSVAEFLRAIQSAQHKRLPYEYVSLAAIEQWASVPPRQRLFDNLILWLAPESAGALSGLELHGVPDRIQTAFPFTLSVAEGNGIVLGGHCQAGYEPILPLGELLDGLERSLGALLAARADAALADLPGFAIDSAEPVEARPPEPRWSHGPERTSEPDHNNAVPISGGREAAELEVLIELLSGAWETVLGRSDVEPDDNFFDIGGDSLLAAQLHTLVQRGSGKLVPLLALFASPTIRGMAETLFEESWPVRSDIVTPVRVDGYLPPLFCIASPEVNSVGYALLAQHLDPRRPVYVVQSLPMSEEIRGISPSELPDMAREYLDAMRAVQTAGPYNLLGMCTGSHIALEMAAQLEAANESVPLLGVVNTWALYTVSQFYRVQRIFNQIGYYRRRIVDLVHRKPGEQIAILKRVCQRRARSIALFAMSSSQPNGDAGAVAPKRNEWIEDVGWATNDRDAPKFQGIVTVLRIRKQAWWRIRDNGLGWGLHAREVNVVTLPGDDHLAIMRNPIVGILAQELEQIMLEDTIAANMPATDCNAFRIGSEIDESVPRGAGAELP